MDNQQHPHYCVSNPEGVETLWRAIDQVFARKDDVSTLVISRAASGTGGEDIQAQIEDIKERLSALEAAVARLQEA